MDQENGNEESQRPAVVTVKTSTPEQNNGGTDNPVVVSIEKQSETNNGESSDPVDAYLKSSEVNIAGTSGEKPTRAERKRFGKSLKAKAAIKKTTSSNVSLNAKKVEGNPQIQQKNKKKNRRLWKENKGGNNNNEENSKNVNVGVDNLEKDVAEIEPAGNNGDSKDNQDKISGPTSSQHDQKSENNRNGQGQKSNKQKKKEKLEANEDKQGDKNKKEKLGGLIFMCSAKTKPDCFRYQVMGVTNNKKDLVLGVRPGLKLFLYDFDLRLMYGVYKASSAGGMRLEPKAFGGSFPIQVKFSVQRDCVPIHESVFKKAIKENYNGNKFDIELSVQQVRKLCALFRPVGFQSVQPAAVPVHSREVERPKDSRSHRERDITRANVLSHERERERDKQPMQAPRDLYMSEKEYRTFGLQRVASALDPYQRDMERELPLRRPASPYDETAFRLREPVLVDPRYPEAENYSFGTRTALPSALPSASAVTALDSYTRDPYYSYPHNPSSGNAYLVPSRREEVGSGSYYVDGIGRREVYAAGVDPIGRRETDEMDMDNVYSRYPVDPTVDYSRAYQPEAELPPVSARYSFAGASASYR